MTTSKKHPKHTDAWKAAEWDYESLQAEAMMPFLGRPPSSDEITEQLADIVRACPKFYPAVLELGLRKLADGGGAAGEQRISEGFQLLLELADPKQLDDELDALIEHLENLWRYDLSRRCLEVAVERHPRKAALRDSLARALAELEDLEGAVQQVSQAVAFAPRNPCFRANLGLYHLMAGNADEARLHLTAAQRRDPDNEAIQGNLKIADYISEHGGDFFDYLLRPVDEDEFKRLDDEGDVEALDARSASYNSSRLEAFARSLARDTDKRPQCAKTMNTLMKFLSFVERVANMAGFLYERLAFVHTHFDAIMHKFIFKFGDVDRQMIEDICGCLVEYYGFLARSCLVSTSHFKRFQRTVRERKKPLIEKMKRYNQIRHDDDLPEHEKEAIREELFEGDHVWPHI
jgi:tetratricopeptide (TPR) repeat protein